MRFLALWGIRFLLVALICGTPIGRGTIAEIKSIWSLQHSPEWRVDGYHSDGEVLTVTAFRRTPLGEAHTPSKFEFHDSALVDLPFRFVIGLVVALIAGFIPGFGKLVDFLSNPIAWYTMQFANDALEGTSPFLDPKPDPWWTILVWNGFAILLWCGVPSAVNGGHTFIAWIVALYTMIGVLMFLGKLKAS